MLYEALGQPVIFLWLSFGGFLSGFLFDLKAVSIYFFKKNKVFDQILQFLALSCTFLLFYFFNLKFNYGEIRLFSILGFVLAFCIQRYLMKNFVANPLIKCYNKVKESRNGRKNKLVEKS